MEKVEKYARAVVNVLNEQVGHSVQNAIEEHVLTDYEHGHFQWLRTGWTGKDSFKLGILIHFHLKPDGKIWILANWTEDDVAKALVEQVVDKNDIVLGFQPAYIRPFSGYAVA